ncbi:MAG: hypothetical protein JNL10_19425 [Verrucomicrobiales bacterium]|nr:hypothetical protein [Verrucomicrobiales bacterium]
MTTKRWRIVADLSVLVLVSALVGGLIGRRIARTELESRNNPKNWNEHVSEEFEDLVHPTPEQRPRVQAHLDRAVRELQEIRRDAVSRSTNVIGRLVTAVEAELTPEQRAKFQRMKPRAGEVDLEVLHNSPAGSPR